jgi:hypothetical protein
MAQDAVPAYDRVIYVGSDHFDRHKVATAKPVAVSPVRAATKKAAKKTPTAKIATPKPAAAKKAVAKKVPTNKTAGTATEAITVSRILVAVPNLKSGQWQPLGDVAKVLQQNCSRSSLITLS